jgi:hypothetical protein
VNRTTDLFAASKSGRQIAGSSDRLPDPDSLVDGTCDDVSRRIGGYFG